MSWVGEASVRRSVGKRAASTRGLLLIVDDVEVVERRRASAKLISFFDSRSVSGRAEFSIASSYE